ncbi:Tripartite tricarboxylate transporter family receptor [compost metagenome]
MVAPANTPAPIIKRLNEVAVKIISSPEVTAKINAYGGDPRPSSAEEYGQFIRSEVQKWDNIVKISGATLD